MPENGFRLEVFAGQGDSVWESGLDSLFTDRRSRENIMESVGKSEVSGKYCQGEGLAVMRPRRGKTAGHRPVSRGVPENVRKADISVLTDESGNIPSIGDGRAARTDRDENIHVGQLTGDAPPAWRGAIFESVPGFRPGFPTDLSTNGHSICMFLPQNHESRAVRPGSHAQADSERLTI